MKVVEIISDTNIGGAGILLVNRMKNTDLNKYSTIILVPKGSRLKDRFFDIGVRCREVDCRGDCSLEWMAVLEYIKILRELNPDVVNCHGCLSGRIAARFLKVPVKICTRHCVFPVSNSERKRSIRNYLNSELSDRFIAVAYAAEENLKELGISSRKISVIINGAEALSSISNEEKIKLKKQMGIGKSSAILGMCARLEQCKGHEWFLKAIKALIDSGEDVVALLVGDGSQREALENLCIAYGIAKNVIFVGFVNDVSPYMNLFDINVNCSVGTETSSLALSEGMSLGKPSIVSNYGGNPYMIKHGENGYVCSLYDSNMLCEYAKRLIHDENLYNKMSKASLKRFEEELNARKMTEKTNLLYDRLFEAYKQSRLEF